MSGFGNDKLRRECYLHTNASQSDLAWEMATLQLLIAQDGSTTRLLEKIAGTKIQVHLLQQREVESPPSQLAGFLPGNRFLRRVTSLEVHGQVLLDALSYVALDVLPSPVVDDLQRGESPIGHLFEHLWVRRQPRHGDTDLLGELWETVGQPDVHASRSGCIHTPRSPCVILAETFRRGALSLLAQSVHHSRAEWGLPQVGPDMP